MSDPVIPKHTPGPWKYGVRKDGSMWISIGDPMHKHSQFDWHGFEEDAQLAMSAPVLLAKVAELEVNYQTLLDDAVDMRAKVSELEAEVERLTR